jgi:DNA-binding beta-propeller fold protein YncE
MKKTNQDIPCPLRVHARCYYRFWAGVFLALEWLAISAAQAQTTNYALGTAVRLEGPTAGSDSVVLAVTPPTGSWTATTNATWLHLSTANQSGAGSGNVVFSYDANPGATRSGTLTIGGQTLTVTQAGSNYVAAEPLTTVVSLGLNTPYGVAADGAGNVYIADSGNDAILKWTASQDAVSRLVYLEPNYPQAVAVDGAGNVYFANSGNSAIEEWTEANGNVITLVSNGLSSPSGLAVDGAGNVYIADTFNNAIKKWAVANNTVITLVSNGLSNPFGVAVDIAGNVYFADTGNNAVKEWTAENSNVITLVTGLNDPQGVAVDGAGNVYIADSDNFLIQEWKAASSSVTALVSLGSSYAIGVAVDGTGNIYLAQNDDNAIKELPYAFVDPASILETDAAGDDVLPVVLPSTENLLAPFAPTSDQPWLTISGINNGVVSFTFAGNPSTASRAAHIALLGQTNLVTQQGVPNYVLGTTSLLVGPGAGSNSVVLAVTPATVTWTATPDATWLHLSLSNQSGAGSTNVIFSYDANAGETRSGTLTVGGQTLTVTQAGSTYVAAGVVTTLASTGLSFPYGVAVDGAGNVYIADYGTSAIEKWTAANNTLTPLISSGLSAPVGVAVDGAGNVYIADTGHSAVKEWTVANSNVTTLVSSGLSGPFSVAVDGAGNVYIADTGHDTIKEWTVANSNVTTLVSSGLGQPNSVAVDVAGNVYIGDFKDNAIKKWTAANNTLTTLASGLDGADGVAVDGAGNVYVADYYDYTIKKWTAASGIVTTLVSSGLYHPGNVAVDGEGNVYIADSYDNALKELPYAFVDPTPKLESVAGGSDTLPAVLPATENLLPPFTPASDQSWLTISGINNDVISFEFAASSVNRTGDILLLGLTIPVTQGGPSYSLGATALLVGPGAGSNSVVLAVGPPTGNWTATTNASWLHLNPANQGGTGSTNVIFSYDANPGATRSGTLTIGGQMLTVTQAGSTYVAAEPVTALVSNGLIHPSGVAVDSAGNVYLVDNGDNAIKKWTVDDNTVTTLVSAGLSDPLGVAVDGAGNVYFADTGHNAIKEWTVANSNVTTLVSSGLNAPQCVAVDGAGNVYITDTDNNALKEWTAADGNVTTLVSSGLNQPNGVAVDGAGNVYIGDFKNNAIVEWTAANNTLTTLVSGLNGADGMAVDGAGNVYVTDYANSTIEKWTAATGAVTTLVSSGLDQPIGVAVDSTGNVYIADTYNNAIKELPYAFVDPTPRLESLAGGNDALPVVLPATENLLPPFTPSSDQPWLTISDVTNGVVSFAFTADTGPSRAGFITLLGQSIPVQQGTGAYALATSALLVGAGAGSNSVVLATTPNFSPWTATTNTSWLHLSPAAQSGFGSTNVVFSFDENPGATRSGTLTIAGQTLTVTQAGSTYVEVLSVTTLVSNGLNYPFGVAVDGSGNVYIADSGDNEIQEWTVANNTLTPLVSSGLSGPIGVAVDGSANVYIADTGNNAIKEWTVANGNVTTLVSSGLSGPFAVAVDGAGNVYIADTGNDAIKEWTVTNQNVVTLVSSGLGHPNGIAVDGAGNVYIGDFLYNVVEKWTAANNTLTTLVSGLSGADGVAVDGEGNVYIAGYGDGAIQKWTAANGVVTTLVSSGLYNPGNVAVDAGGNVYIANSYTNAIEELPYAFVDPTPRLESLAGGNDALPVVLPATENLLPPFTPTSDQPWLTIGEITNGVVDFSFTADTGPTQAAHITLLGQSITIQQGAAAYFLGTSALLLGPSAGSNSVVLAVLPVIGAWTATTNAAWLHLSTANQSGSGSTNVVFSYDANPGATRSGTLTIAGQTLTVTQAGSTYVAVGPMTTLVSNGLGHPTGVAVDGAGNVYIVDFDNDAIKEWTPASNEVTTLVSSGISAPIGVAVDGAGNVYFADTGSNSIEEWTAANSNVTTLVSSGLNAPQCVAVDDAGNVYITDSVNNALKEWTVANGNVITLASSGLDVPNGVAVDRAGNVYIGDFLNLAIEKWTAATSTLSTLVSGLNGADGMAVDGAGNLYITDYADSRIEKWTAANGAVTILVPSGLNQPIGVAVDATGNVYIADTYNDAIKELPYAFVDPTPRLETVAAGSDALPVVLPLTENLRAPFAPSSDQSWLTITGITNGVVSFSFTANTNTGSARTAHITLLGQTISITQVVIGTPPTLTGARMLASGVLQFAFTNTPNASFTVLSSTNLSLPLSNWTVVGTATNTGGGQFQFTSQPTTNDPQRYYSVRSP